MNLIIVESPTKARTLSRFLGKEYNVEATMGHIKDLPKGKLGIDIDKWKVDYVVMPGKEEAIEKIEKASKGVDNVYIATDPDREGEAIAYHVYELLNPRGRSMGKSGKYLRIVFHEITKEAVEEAIGHPREVDEKLVDAQTGRRVLDRLVGYKFSPLLWKKIRIGLSAGRVQSVAVRLIVEREREIEKFKRVEYWEIFADLKKKGGTKKDLFRAQLLKIGDKKGDIGDSAVSRKVVGDLKSSVYSVGKVNKREVKKRPYPPLTTSTMTQAGSRLYGWSAKRTMSVAQKLYEKGYITYHRTDSTNIAAVAVSGVRDHIKRDYGENYLPEKPIFYKTKSKSAQEAHEAIRPTKVDLTRDNLKMRKAFARDAGRLYELIWRRFVACQMTPSVYDETRIDVKAVPKRTGHAKLYILRVSGQVIKFDGWRRVLPSGAAEKEAVRLPEIVDGDPLDLVKLDPQQKFTQPPPRYNEASLIKMLEKLGIGRPSTYAPTISTIQYRKYVEKGEGKFVPTTIGITVNDFLIKHFPDVFDYQFTAEMEKDLDDIAEGKKKWEKIVKDFWAPMEKKVKKVEKEAERVKIPTEKIGKKCKKCKKGELVIRVGRFGKFISCERFPDCDFTDKYLEKIGMKCPDCKKGDVIVKKTGKGRNFFGCSRYPECKYASWKDPKAEKKKKK